MMKRMMAAVLAAVLIGTLTPATFAFAQGNDPDAQAAAETTATETEESTENADESADAAESNRGRRMCRTNTAGMTS